MAIKIITVPIFENIRIHMSDNIAKDFPKWVKKVFKDGKLPDDCDANNIDEVAGYVLSNEAGDIFMGVNCEELERVIVHESVHVGYEIVDYVGIQVSADNNEILAYLTEWVFDQYLSKFRI